MQVIIITGANVGLGFETALDLAKRGATLILACRYLVTAFCFPVASDENDSRFRQCFGSGFNQDSGSIRIRIQIRNPDPDPGRQKLFTKIKKEILCFEVLDVLF